MRQLLVLFLLCTLVSTPSWANFGEGQARFSGGDYEGAFKVWQPLANAGDPRAQYSLGILYEQGLGIGADLRQAENWFALAAKQNYAPAQAALRAVRAKIAAAGTPAAKPRATPGQSARLRPAPGYPKPLSEKEQVEALVHDLLRQIDLQLRTGQLSYEKVSVYETAAGFDIDVYGLSIDSGPRRRLVIGDVGGRVTRDGDRYYKIGFLLPSTMYAYEPEAEQPSEIKLGAQNSRIVWDRDLEIVVDADVDVADFSVIDPSGRKKARIANILLVSDLADKGGFWSGPVAFSMRGIEASEGNSFKIKLGEIGLRTVVDRLDMERYAALSRAVKQGGHTPEQTIEEIRHLLAGVAIEFTLADLVVGSESTEAAASLERANYHLGFSGLDRSLATIAMAYKHGGLVGSTPDVPELTPRDAKISITLDRLPIETIIQTGVVAALEYMFFGEVGAKSDVLNHLRIALSDAQSELRIEDGEFQTPRFLVTIAGILAADAQALWGIAGEIGITIVGLDTLIHAMEKSDPAKNGAGQPGSFGSILRAYGEPSSDGKTHIYKIQVTREGRVLVNGQDGMPLIAALFSG